MGRLWFQRKAQLFAVTITLLACIKAKLLPSLALHIYYKYILFRKFLLFFRKIVDKIFQVAKLIFILRLAIVCSVSEYKTER